MQPLLLVKKVQTRCSSLDAIKYAKAESKDVIIIDTAGRLHTKSNLMDELKR